MGDIGGATSVRGGPASTGASYPGCLLQQRHCRRLEGAWLLSGTDARLDEDPARTISCDACRCEVSTNPPTHAQTHARTHARPLLHDVCTRILSPHG